jgi:hypothetical protein
LDVSECTDLVHDFDCSFNQLTSLDVSKNTKLRNLDCSSNQLTSLILGTKSSLFVLRCNFNEIANLDMENCPQLTEAFSKGEKTDHETWIHYHIHIYKGSYEMDLDYELDVDKATKVLTSVPKPTVTLSPTPMVSSTPTETPTPVPTVTPIMTSTPVLTNTPAPTVTSVPVTTQPIPTSGSVSTNTPAPTVTPVPVTTQPIPTSGPVSTNTPAPTVTPVPVTTQPTPTSGPVSTNTPAPTVTTVPGVPAPTITLTPVPTEAPTIGDFVERLYTVALDRKSDPDGKKYWVDEIKNGKKTGGECAHFFLIDAPEFLNRGLSDEDFVETLYKTFFDRASEAAGKTFWVNSIKTKKMSREDVIGGFIDSTEWCNICATYGVKSGAPNAKSEVASQNAINFATRLYTCCLGRDPEEKGLEYWSLALTNLEKTGCEAAGFFFTSDEFVGFKLKNDEYVRRLYTTFMDRDPEDSEIAYWVGEIVKGTQTKESVIAFFGQSPEFTNICKTYGIDRGTI